MVYLQFTKVLKVPWYPCQNNMANMDFGHSNFSSMSKLDSKLSLLQCNCQGMSSWHKHTRQTKHKRHSTHGGTHQTTRLIQHQDTNTLSRKQSNCMLIGWGFRKSPPSQPHTAQIQEYHWLSLSPILLKPHWLLHQNQWPNLPDKH